MASTRLAHHSHHSHGPPPATSGQPAGALLFQKSHVVAGVQDAYWSDDEEEEPECPLCVGEMDMDDLNFKPCPCGYQICGFCYHHIKQNLNGRCPACRREYSEDTVEYTAMSPEDQKRLSNQKKQKEKEKKELEALKRGHLPNMRVVQRNVVYVTGLGPRFAKEELIPSLRSHEYFGQYGKISKIVLVKRSGTATREATTGIYITYNRREDAARAIAGVDGSPSPGGGGEVMRASYGTTKYCMNFLRNITCTGCMELHEWGDEKDSFTKEDLATLKHALKDTETRQKYTVAREADSLPRGASWATKGASPKPSTMAAIPISTRESRSTRGARTSGRPGTSQSSRTTQPPDVTRASRNADRDRSDIQRERDKERDKKGHTHTSSSGSAGAAASAVPARAKSPLASSRPSTPASSLPRRPPTATDAASSPSPTSSPGSSTRPTLPPEPSTTSIPQRLMEAVTSSTPPPTVSTPAPPSEPSNDQPYRLSGNVQALLDDVVTRRETKPQTFQSPFPDLDRTLAALGNADFSFSFNLDPKLIPPKGAGSAIRSAPGRESPTLYGGFDPFGLTSVASPSLPQSSQSPALPPPPGLGTRQQSVSSMIGNSFASPDPIRNSYTGSFDPFAEPSAARETPPTGHAHLIEDETARRGSRFGFAQKKASDSRFSSAAASPLVLSDNLPQTPLYASSDLVSPAPSSSQPLPQWTYPTQQQDFSLAQGISQLQLQANAVRAAQQAPPGFGGVPRFSPFGTSSNADAALKELVNIGRNQQGPRREPVHNYGQQGFNDPAIMSMRMSGVANGEMMFQQSIRQAAMMDGPTQVPFGGPPPGLVNMPPPGLGRPPMNSRMTNGHVHPAMQSLNAQQVSEYAPFPQFSPSTSAALVSPALAAISPLVSSSLPVSSPVVASSVTAASQTPAFSASDFPELSSIPVERERPRRENSASHSKKPEGKTNRKTSVSQTPALPSLAPVASSPKVKQDAGPASPKPDQHSDILSAPLTTPASVKGDAEAASPVLTSIGRAIVPLDLPAAVPPLSRKQKRMQAKMQAKEKAAPSSTHSMSTPASRVPSPPPASPPVTHQVSQEQEAPSTHSLAHNHTPVVDDKPTSPSTAPTASHPVATPVSESQEPRSTSGKASQQSQPPSLKVAIGPPASASQLPNPSPAPSEPDVPASAVTETAPESATTGLSKKQRKILAAKAAREAAEARALEAAKAQVATNKVVPEAPYENLVSAEELLHRGKGVLHEEYPSFLNQRSLEGKGSAAVPYAPLVDALTVLSIGNCAFTDGMPSSSSAIASFQQLLETLTQAISELLRLLPGITWADNSSFDSAILDILKAEDFMADGTHIQLDQDSDVETLTLALEKRAKWMKTQLTKLEELHRDINWAAVRAVLSLNDRGWDARGILSKSTGSLERFEQLGTVQVEGGARGMSLVELTEALKEARRQESEVEMQLKEFMKLNALATS